MSEFTIASPIGQLGPPKDRRDYRPPGEGGTRTTRFNLDNIGFFDLFYDSKSIDTAPAIEYTGKSTFFRDIYIFIDRVKDIARIKGEELVR